MSILKQISLLTLGFIIASSAIADCQQVYRDHIKSNHISLDQAFLGGGSAGFVGGFLAPMAVSSVRNASCSSGDYECEDEAGEGLGAPEAIPVFGLATTVGVMAGASTNNLLLKRHEKPLKLIQEARIGRGLLISKVALKLRDRGVVVSAETLADRIADDSRADVFCSGKDLYSFGDIVDYLEALY